jgi:plasmanylethanolamine desaturase
MIDEDQVTYEQVRPETSRGHYLLEIFGILCFALLALLIAVELYGGVLRFGDLWLAPILLVLAYLAADFLSGFVHFLADNFGSYDTPILGPNFIEPFREHHVDPKGIVGHDFVDANGNNSLATLPFMLFVWIVVPLETWYFGYLFGAFFLFLCLAAFLTNQFHKWAHMDDPPAFVAWLQARGVILSQEHHDIHHESPYDTYYCITAGFWNPLLDRIRFYERTERLIRRAVPGTDPMLRSEREGNLNG